MSAYWQYLVEASVSLQICCHAAVKSGLGKRCSGGEIADAAFLESCSQNNSADEIESLFYLPTADGTEGFLHDLLEVLEAIPTLGQIYSSANHKHFLNIALASLDDHPEISFRLAILKVCLPFEYERTLFCIWLAIFESEHSAREDGKFIEFFLCAVCHDLGLLDVNPRFTRRGHDPRSSKDDSQGYYTHVDHSAQFLSRLTDVSSKVIKSIRQHHENMDGTGYPLGKSGNQLAEYGQFIHLFDTLFSIYSKNYKPLKRSLADLVPIIEINAITHFGQGAIRLVEILKQAPRSDDVFFSKEEFQKIQKETDAMAAYIEKSIGLIQVFTSSVGFRHEDKTLFALQNSFIHIALAYYKLRVLHKQAVMSDALSDEGDYVRVAKALEDNFFTLREIIFHVNKFLYRLRVFRQHNDEGIVAEKASETIDELSSLTLKLIN